jgi:alpha/beta superfamily hydrolase
MWRGFKAHQHGFPSADSLFFNYRGSGNGTYVTGVGEVENHILSSS